MKHDLSAEHVKLLSGEDSPHYFKSAKYKNADSPMHVNYCMEIIIVSEGVLNMVVGGSEYEIREGEAVFIQPFELHSFISMQANVCNVIVFSPNLVSDFFDFIKKNSPVSCLFTVSKDVLALVDRLLPSEENTGDDIRSQAALFPLCCDIRDKLEFKHRKTKFDDPLHNALSYINLHFTERITLESVAHQVGIHPVTLSRKLASLAKTNFNAYLNYQRCTYAASLITSGKISCTEVAFTSGFGSIRSFNRAFLNIYGVTPTEFRNAPDRFKDTYYH